MPRQFRLLIALAACAICLPVRAETTECTTIAAVPITITVPGVYCLFQDFQTNFAGGTAAIQIATSNVIIDMNTHRLGNLAAGPATIAVGIYAAGQQSITIKNGTIRGFLRGIELDDVNPPISQAHIVEDMRLDRNTQSGVSLAGINSVVRRNQIVSTGGSTSGVAGSTSAYGINASGSGNRIIDNDVVNTGGATDTQAYGIGLLNADGAVVSDNRISEVVAGAAGEGIFIASGNRVIVRNNQISNTGSASYGLYCASPSVVMYTDNIATGFITPYMCNTPVGINYGAAGR